MENVNIPQDSIWAQKDEIDSKKVYKKVNFDTKNYLNVKLKENKKNGYFGKLDGGIANEEYHQAQGIYNFFKDN